MNDFIHRRGIAALAIGATLLTSACGKDAGSPANGATATAAEKTSDSKGKAGHVIVVQLTSDATGNSFTPSDIVAERGDTVRFTSLRPYRVRITGRTKHFLNAFGEEVVIENAEAAVAAAARATGVLVRDYTAAPVYDATHGRHEWAVEFSGQPPAEPARFAAVLDQALRQLNSDYDVRRNRAVALSEPLLHVLPAGTFERWLGQQGRLGGQYKVPRLSNSRQVLEEVLALVSRKP